MNATSYQVKVLQAACANKFRSRDERLEAVGDILGVELTSFSELTSLQADELISFFKTGKFPENKTWAIFDKANAQHRTILSHCHTLGWKNEENPAFVDLNRLGGWLKSNRSPVPKPLKEMTRIELSKVIAALENMIKKRYK